MAKQVRQVRPPGGHRRDPQEAEGRRAPPRLAIVGVCVLIAVVIVGAAAYGPIKDKWDQREFDDVELADIGAAGVGLPGGHHQEGADGNQDHVPTGSPVDYADAPPAFGSHWNEAGVAPAPFDAEVLHRDDRPELESLVHNLEHGYTILWYDETIADDEDAIDQIEAIADKFDAGASNFRTSSSPRPGPPTTRTARRSPTASTSRSRTGRPAAPARPTRQAGRRLAVLLRAQRRGPRRPSWGVPLHRLARARTRC